ncbi:hypothetical protein PM082_022632 [Marasmius tenuissimus]|nr:hypothetical protein PM082_022632 [Marasmius tenuissimus]
MTTTLTRAERARLIRTTRKLGALLGETPTIEVVEPPSRTRSRPGTASSVASTSSVRSCLTINIPAASLSLPQRSPLSPTFSLNRDSPYSACEEPNVVDMRRRKVAKLSRTFGENVPPELITSAVGGDRASYDGLGEASESSETLSSFKMKGHSLDLDTHGEFFLDFKPTSEAPPPLPPKSPRAARHMSLVVRSPRQKSFHNHAPSENFSRQRKNSDRDLAFSKLTQHLTPAKPSHNAKVDETYRRQNGWSGEWNQGDMREVMDRLRHLK